MEKYEKQFEISSYECDENKNLRIRSLFNLFQDLADNHAAKIGVGYDYCVENKLGWIGGAYHVQIERLPVWNDKVILTTWPSMKTAVTAIREFEMRDAVTGDVLVRASSQWVLIDAVRMRPVSVLQHLTHCDAIEERAVETDFRKLSVPERIDYTATQIARTDDMDLNHHVNNAVYPTWILDALPVDYLNTHALSELQIQYKSPAKAGATVIVQTQMDKDTGLHMITGYDSKTEFARSRTVWKTK